jgi:hypothetical protein
MKLWPPTIGWRHFWQVSSVFAKLPPPLPALMSPPAPAQDQDQCQYQYQLNLLMPLLTWH